MSTHIFLTGPRACGKSTLGKRLAHTLRLPYIDMDVTLQTRLGQSIALFVRRAGWEAFRNEETLLLQEICEAAPSVVATGGGVVLAAENRELMQNCGFVLYLQTDAVTLANRLSAAPMPGQRPPLSELPLQQEIEKSLEERGPLYAACAHAALDASLPLEALEQSALDVMATGKRNGAES